MPRTSDEAYAFAMESGLISRRRLQVLEFCCTRGQRPPYNNRISRNDVKKHFNDMHDSFCRRLEELAAIGLMTYAGEKPDAASGHAVDCYEVNLEATTASITEGLNRLRESQARMTHGRALERLVEELEEWILPHVEGRVQRNLARAIRRARSRVPGSAVRRRREHNGNE